MGPSSITPSPAPGEPSPGQNIVANSSQNGGANGGGDIKLPSTAIKISEQGDISRIIKSFPNGNNVRLIIDGTLREALQFITHNKVLQVNLKPPYIPHSLSAAHLETSTFLEHYSTLVARRAGTSNPCLLKEECDDLNDEFEACRLLTESCGVLGRWEVVQEASAHMLSIISLMDTFAPDDEMAEVFGKHYPETLMRNVIAQVHCSMGNDPAAAISIIDRYLPVLREYYSQDDSEPASGYLAALERQRAVLFGKLSAGGSRMPITPPSRPESQNPVPSEYDISKILSEWGENPVRKIPGASGNLVIQKRLSYGIVQFADKSHPLGCNFSGNRHTSRLDQFKASAACFEKTRGRPFKPDEAIFSAIKEDYSLFYERARCRERLEEWPGMLEDLRVCIESLEFILCHSSKGSTLAQVERDLLHLRAYEARALAEIDLSGNNYQAAIDKLNRLERELPHSESEEFTTQDVPAVLECLRYWRDDLVLRMPADCKPRLQHELQEAIKLEDYEKAAQIKRQLRNLQGPEAV